MPTPTLELFDSHCHLTADAFDGDRAEVLARAREAGVRRLVTIASNLADAGAALDLARDSDWIWTTAGIHPHEAGSQGPDDLHRIRDLLTSEPRAVAVGETGLDYFYDHAPRDVQRRSFLAHAELAADLGLPLVVHCRDADEDMASILRDLPPGLLGVLHCFVGGDQLLETALEIGWFVSFTGIASFKKFDAADRLRRVPSDRLMIETDAPYLAPVPLRGRRNEPAFVEHVCRAVAAHRDVEPAELARATLENANRFYNLEQDRV